MQEYVCVAAFPTGCMKSYVEHLRWCTYPWHDSSCHCVLQSHCWGPNTSLLFRWYALINALKQLYGFAEVMNREHAVAAAATNQLTEQLAVQQLAVKQALKQVC